MARQEMFNHSRIAVTANDGISDIQPQRDWNGNSHTQQGILGFLGTSVTLSSNSFTATDSLNIITGATNPDNLKTINYTSSRNFDWLQLVAASGQTITVQHGTGNIFLQGSINKVLSNNLPLILFFYNNSWYEFAAYNPAITNAQNIFTNQNIINLNTYGINTIPTDAILQLVGFSSYTGQYIDVYGANAGITFRRADGSLASPTALAISDEIGRVSARGYDGTSFTSSSNAKLSFFASENWQHSPAHYGTYASISVTNTGTSILNEVFRWNADGSFQVYDPTFTYSLKFVPPLISAGRTINLPLVTGTDSLAALGVSQTWSALQIFGNNISIGGATVNVASLATGQLLQYNGTNWVNINPSTITSLVDSVSNSDGTLTISPTTGNVLASLNIGHSNIWSALQTFGAGITNTGSTNIISNPTASTSGTTTVNSGYLDNFGSYWNGTVSVNYGFRIISIMDSTTPTAHFSVRLNNNGTITELWKIDQGGNSTYVTGGATLSLSGSTSGTTALKASAVASGTITIPAVTDTLAVLGTSQTFTATTTTINNLQLGGNLNANSEAITSLNYLTFNAIADSSISGKLYLSSTTANVLKYYDTQATPVLHQLATLDIAQSFTGLQTFGNNISIGGATVNVSSLASNQVLQYNGTNWVNVTIASGAVSSVSNSDGTLTISPTTGAVVASIALGHANTWTAAQTFAASGIILKGAGTGTVTFSYTNTSSNSTITVPAVGTDTLATLGASQTFSNTCSFVTLALSGTMETNGNIITSTPNSSTAFRFTDTSNNVYLGINTQSGTNGISVITMTPAVAPSFAAAAGNSFTNVSLSAYTLTQTGGTTVTAFNGLQLNVNTPTITDTTAMTISTASTVYIANAPVAAGSVTITNAYALHVAGGTTQLQSTNIGGTLALGNNTVSGTPTFSGAVKFNSTINGVTISSITSGTFTLTNTKTFSVNNSLTLQGTDGTVFTFPGSSDTVVTLAASQTLTNKIMTSPILNGVTVTDKTKTSAYTLTSTDDIIRADATSGAFTLTLPSSSTAGAGKIYTIIKIDTSLANLITINTSSSQTIGITGITSWILSQVGDYLIIESDGSNWKLIGNFIPTSMSYRPKGSTLNLMVSSSIVSNNLGSNTLATAANIVATPFIVSKPSTFDTISVNVTTAVASSNMRLGIYTDNGNVYPSSLVSNSDTGDISTATTGIKTATFSTAITLQPGLYWLVFLPSSAIATTTITGSSIANVLGFNNTSLAANSALQVAQTYGALPAIFPSSSTTQTGSQVFIGLRQLS